MPGSQIRLHCNRYRFEPQKYPNPSPQIPICTDVDTFAAQPALFQRTPRLKRTPTTVGTYLSNRPSDLSLARQTTGNTLLEPARQHENQSKSSPNQNQCPLARRRDEVGIAIFKYSSPACQAASVDNHARKLSGSVHTGIECCCSLLDSILLFFEIIVLKSQLGVNEVIIWFAFSRFPTRISPPSNHHALLFTSPRYQKINLHRSKSFVACCMQHST